ncbi:MAG: TIGR03936 family radical SAM-associated protein [Chloroflexota bacterium]
MNADYVQRLRLSFTKTGGARYIGHLDLARTLERALNRARIPMAYSHGFNRRPRMQMAAALPLGYTSDHEMADIWLLETMEPSVLQETLMAKMAPGIDIYQVDDVPIKAPKLQTLTEKSSYSATMLDPVDMAALRDRVDQLLAETSIIRERGHGRKRKKYDLRPLILDLSLTTDAEDRAFLEMMLQLLPSKTGRPDEVLMALELDPLDSRINRTQIFLREETAVVKN